MVDYQLDERFSFAVFIEKVKQYESDLKADKFEISKDSYLIFGAITLLQEAFCGRLQGGIHRKPYYAMLGLNYGFRDDTPNFPVQLPEEINTRNIMKIDLLSLLDSIKT